MEIYNHTKMYCVYATKCNVTNNIYIGSTSNITNRLRHHISTHKNHKSTCSSQMILENRNYIASVLRKDILTKQAAKEAEYNFIKGYGADCELELELIQTQMAQKPMLRAEVGMRVRCANKASAE